MIAEHVFGHVNRVADRMLEIRDRLGDIEARDEQITDAERAEIGRMFDGDITLFRFMDEAPGHWLVNGRPPEGERGGSGFYYDGKGRCGWHRLLRQLRNEPGVSFWDAFHHKHQQ